MLPPLSCKGKTLSAGQIQPGRTFSTAFRAASRNSTGTAPAASQRKPSTIRAHWHSVSIWHAHSSSRTVDHLIAQGRVGVQGLGLASFQKLQKLVLGEDRDTQLPGLAQLAAGVLPRYHVGGLF